MSDCQDWHITQNSNTSDKNVTMETIAVKVFEMRSPNLHVHIRGLGSQPCGVLAKFLHTQFPKSCLNPWFTAMQC